MKGTPTDRWWSCWFEFPKFFFNRGVSRRSIYCDRKAKLIVTYTVIYSWIYYDEWRHEYHTSWGWNGWFGFRGRLVWWRSDRQSGFPFYEANRFKRNEWALDWYSTSLGPLPKRCLCPPISWTPIWGASPTRSPVLRPPFPALRDGGSVCGEGD